MVAMKKQISGNKRSRDSITTSKTNSRSSTGRKSTTASTTNTGATNPLAASQLEESPADYLRSIFPDNNIERKTKFQKPSQEETDAYDLVIVRAIRSKDVAKLQSLHAEGKSLNACNQFGESLIHMACRRGDLETIRFMIEQAQVRLSIKDDFGRTPLHDACWTPTPNFDVMDLLMKHASPEMLLCEDVRGHTPFDYARKEHWSKWLDFLKQRKDFIISKSRQAPFSACC